MLLDSLEDTLIQTLTAIPHDVLHYLLYTSLNHTEIMKPVNMILGGIMILLGLILGIHTLQIYNTTHVFTVSYAIIVSILVIIGVIAMFMALMLNMLPSMIRQVHEELV